MQLGIPQEFGLFLLENPALGRAGRNPAKVSQLSRKSLASRVSEWRVRLRVGMFGRGCQVAEAQGTDTLRCKYARAELRLIDVRQ